MLAPSGGLIRRPMSVPSHSDAIASSCEDLCPRLHLRCTCSRIHLSNYQKLAAAQYLRKDIV